MAEVLLTHSYHLMYDPKQVRKMQPYPPLGTLYAAAVLRDHGISVAVFDTMLQNPEELFPAVLAWHRPKVVVIYEDDFNFLSKMCLTRMREVAFDMIAATVRAGAKVIVHGSDATDYALLYLEAGADYVLCGEAELRLRELVSALLLEHAPAELPGLIYLDEKNRLQHVATTPGGVDWSKMPAPARDLIDLEPYRQAWMEAHGYFSVNLVASRGCPYRCNWCAKPISGHRFHVRPARLVAEELAELQQKYAADHVWFADDIFALDHRWAREFAEQMEQTGVRVPFRVQARADLMTPETVESLRRAGCAEVWMGVESGSQKILDAMEKGLRLDEVLRAREALAKAGIRACYFLQFGYPGEKWPEIQQTIDLVRWSKPDDIGVSVSYPLPNTRFYARVQHQLGKKRNWRDSDDLCVTFTAAYKSEFYLAIRDALHAEVNAWRKPSAESAARIEGLWQRVTAMEHGARNARPTQLSVPDVQRASQLLEIRNLSISAGEV